MGLWVSVSGRVKALPGDGPSMAHVRVEGDTTLSEPVLVEGLPGAGLVGKIAADHLVDSFDMTYHAGVHCEGLPDAVVYHPDSRELVPPVRLYADGERDLLVLQSDVPVSPSRAGEFAGCVTGWVADNDALPVYLSGLPEEKEPDQVPRVYGVATGGVDGLLDGTDVGPPPEGGLVSGPTGALLSAAARREVGALGVIAETEARFPDPEAARAVLKRAIEPVAGVEVETDTLVDRAEEIRRAKERIARQIQEGGDESSEAQPLRMFQ